MKINKILPELFKYPKNKVKNPMTHNKIASSILINKFRWLLQRKYLIPILFVLKVVSPTLSQAKMPSNNKTSTMEGR